MVRRYILPLRGKHKHSGSHGELSQCQPDRPGTGFIQPSHEHTKGEPAHNCTTYTSNGVKRCISGRPKCTVSPSSQNIRPVVFGSHSMDCRSLSSESESEDISDSETEYEESADEEDYQESEPDEPITESSELLDPEFQRLKKDLLDLSYAETEDWAASAKYSTPPDERRPVFKRARMSTWQTETARLEESFENDDFIVVSPPTGYFHLACPFYSSDPQKYRDCLIHHDFQSFNDVINHIGCHHMQPVYCPICYQIFNRVMDRDTHILQRTCEMVDQKKMEGINHYQWIQLKKYSKRRLGVDVCSKLIWSTLFPDLEPPGSTYLQGGCGLKISMVRDFWRRNGQNYVSRFVERQGLDDTKAGSGSIQIALTKLILKGLVQKAFERYESDM